MEQGRSQRENRSGERQVKQAAGDLTDDEQLRNEGVADEAAGEVQEAFGKGRRKVGEAIEDLGKKIGKYDFASCQPLCSACRNFFTGGDRR